jgi:hypothetical protein
LTISYRKEHTNTVPKFVSANFDHYKGYVVSVFLAADDCCHSPARFVECFMGQFRLPPATSCRARRIPCITTDEECTMRLSVITFCAVLLFWTGSGEIRAAGDDAKGVHIKGS